MRLLIALAALLLPLTSAAQTAEKAKTQLTWLGHAAFLLQTPGGANILVDPWLENPKAPEGVQLPETIDLLLVSHGHDDHVGQAKDFMQKGARLFAANELNRLLGAQQMGGNIGGSVQVKDATVHLVQAVHSSSYDVSEKLSGQYAGNPVGFVIEIANGPTIYHAGDTGLFGDMELIGRTLKPRVALLPIGGHFTMGPVDAARAARMLGVQTVVPMHFGTFPALTGTPEQLRRALQAEKSKAKMQVMEPGKAVSL